MSGPSRPCPCPGDDTSEESGLSVNCECPRDENEIVIHEKSCLMYKHETIIFPPVRMGEAARELRRRWFQRAPPRLSLAGEAGQQAKAVVVIVEFIYDIEVVCDLCKCPRIKCRCVKPAGREAFDEWRDNRPVGAMPAVLESTHPLMQKFQETLKQFLIKENAIAEEEILNLREELKLSKQSYEKDLSAIYTRDHDTNAQRALILEYESTLAQRAAERQAAEKRAQESNEKYKKVKAKLEQDVMREREAIEELEALTTLCRQLESWRDETESDLTVSQRMSDKMRAEKLALANEKRQLDMLLFGLSNEVWKLETKLETFQKQMEIKNAEMEKINDKVTAYSTELEDLELDKRRLMSLWNSVIGNIKQRDKVYNSVRDDYKMLQESYRTLINNLEITKKVVMEEMNKGRHLAMTKDKLLYDIEHSSKQVQNEDIKKVTLETNIAELEESIEMTDRDREMIKSENTAMSNILKSTEKELQRKTELKMKLENEILANMQDCLLNDKAVESMANGIKKMREMSKKQELALMTMENQHAKVMLDIEVYRNRQAKNNLLMEEKLAKVKDREKEIDDLQEDYDQKVLVLTRKQRELDIVTKKFIALKELFDMKSPQERRIDELESQVKSYRERTETMQHEWLRLQGHVVKLTEQHHKMVSDINLVNKQIQICEQKIMHTQAECETVLMERARVERSLRELRGRLEVLERTRRDAFERNENAQKTNVAMTHEYAANLKDAESEIIQLEDDIEELDKEKMNLTQDLDRVQREALIWQRKGILAVELKRNISNAKSAAGEIGQMRAEIHRMEVRREQLRRTSEKLADDLALYVTRRDTAMDKTRAAAAVEKAQGGHGTSQSAYHHKLRLAKADVARVTKDLAAAKSQMEHLQKEQERLDREVIETSTMNMQLEQHVADLIRECQETDTMKQWLLERVVRSQRLGSELSTAVKRQSVRVRKPKNVVLEEYNQARTLNETLKFIVDTLKKEYPHLTHKFQTLHNTLDIYSPSNSPRLTEGGGDCVESGQFEAELREELEKSENIAEKPLCPD